MMRILRCSYSSRPKSTVGLYQHETQSCSFSACNGQANKREPVPVAHEADKALTRQHSSLKQGDRTATGSTEWEKLIRFTLFRSTFAARPRHKELYLHVGFAVGSTVWQ